MKKIFLLTGLFLLLATSAFGEYYQYTDESGNTRFTDDLYQVPEAQRSGVKTFESVASQPEETAETVQKPETSEAASRETGNDTGESASQTNAAELNKTQSELSATRTALEEEKAELEAQAPKQNATSTERIEYSVKVDALNAKTVQYGEDLKAFEEKVSEFNNRKKKLTETSK